MQDQLSFICTPYTHKTVTVKKLIKTLGRPNGHSCERQQSVQFNEAKSNKQKDKHRNSRGRATHPKVRKYAMS